MKIVILNACRNFFFAIIFFATPAIAQTDQQGDIIALIETIRNVMPGSGSNGFDIPTNNEKDIFGNVIASMKIQDFSSIQSQVSSYGYNLVRWYNIPTSETLYVLKENTPILHGWGTYIFKPSGAFDCALEVPHPIWDTRSWNMGIRTFLRLNSRWFFMAGTHRYANNDSSSDVAHETQTIFYKAHQVVASNLALQIHGFGKSDPVYAGYPDVVISAGMLYPPNSAFTLKTKYESQGFTAGVFSLSTQSSLSRLGATTNKEGQWSNANSKTFIHIEHDTPLRTDSVKTAKVLEAIYQTLGSVVGVAEGETKSPGSFALLQNYPNPFNPKTDFQFNIQEASHVVLKVLDLTGREVATIVNEQMPAGSYLRTWDASQSLTASGVYLASINVGEKIETRKIIFIQ